MIVSNHNTHSNRNVTHNATIALGSNMGDRIGHIESALALMKKQGLRILAVSPLYETKAMYYEDQAAFLNGVCQIECTLDPLPLLDLLQSLENDLARKRMIDKGPRTIDLDIILYDQQLIQTERLHIPHKLILEREFVLRPLADILPNEHLPSAFAGSVANRPIHHFLTALQAKDSTMSPVVTLTPQLPLLRAIDPNRATHVMAILNMTPDSFSDGGSHTKSDPDTLAETVRAYIAAGATIIDIGGQSTRPNAELITPAEELRRIIPAIKLIRNMHDAENIAISIDTFYADVAREAIGAGADIINDISAGNLDSNMLSTVAALGKTIILMHMRGDPSTMTKLTNYPHGVIQGVAEELSARVDAAMKAGIPRWRIILDPGIGFAKTQAQNVELLRNLHFLRTHPKYQDKLGGLPWLIGTSRKKFIGQLTGVDEPSQRTWGTAAAVTASIAGGADIVRVHDVDEMVKVSKMADAIYRTPVA